MEARRRVWKKFLKHFTGAKIQYININHLDLKPPITPESLPLHPDPSDVAF